MTISFPNPSRHFDESKETVQFWGYDSALEISFSVDSSALKKLSPKMDDLEAGFLKAFDDSLAKIHKAANKVYKRGRKSQGAYALAAEDF